jgi:hypothetical protein
MCNVSWAGKCNKLVSKEVSVCYREHVLQQAGYQDVLYWLARELSACSIVLHPTTIQTHYLQCFHMLPILSFIRSFYFIHISMVLRPCLGLWCFLSVVIPYIAVGPLGDETLTALVTQRYPSLLWDSKSRPPGLRPRGHRHRPWFPESGARLFLSYSHLQGELRNTITIEHII